MNYSKTELDGNLFFFFYSSHWDGWAEKAWAHSSAKAAYPVRLMQRRSDSSCSHVQSCSRVDGATRSCVFLRSRRKEEKVLQKVLRVGEGLTLRSALGR